MSLKRLSEVMRDKLSTHGWKYAEHASLQYGIEMWCKPTGVICPPLSLNEAYLELEARHKFVRDVATKPKETCGK